ncbi:family 16 glycosylhydrolase [Bradyrhizobium japonicum]|uniref:family 16 glycosylhydrolase n=1 Tax=Bradyrhizobium japonicum TaxID=375 RepID=UPI001B8A0A9A|nr:family 16 glycosylhydrolase [Bradyrhizobium japonicum]MBR0973085.1 family 16 glycosylhydrolase [Bradyrhizobium japonicum]
MTLSAPAGYTSSDLIFQEDFSGTTLDSYWHNYITSNAANGWPWNSYGSGGSGVGGPYDADYFMPSQVTVNNGVLDLTAIRQSVSGMNQGTQQTFPITSGTVSSYGNFEFNGGYLQISMKAPSGDGAWPGLWLMPGKGAGSSGDNFEIDIQEGGYTGSGPANQAFSWHLHTPSGTVGGTVDTGVDLTAAFHTYAIDWQPGKSITWYLDGKQIAQVTSAQVPIPNEPMELIMDNQVANSNTTGWHTALDSSTPSSMPMQIDAIQLYQKAGSGETVTGANVTATTQPTVQPAVTQATASPATGIEHAGDTITLSLAFNEAVTVTGTPTLSLNDGNTATYVGGSGTGTLTFRSTVASTDKDTSALAITGVNLPSGATIKDASGVAANLAGAVKTFTGLQIDPILPAVTQATASPTTGTEHVGDTITLSLGFNEAVTVTGTPTLSLNDGGTATYAGGSGTGTLTFKTTVASTNTSTSALAIIGVNLPSGATIKDASGVAANLAGAVKTFSGLQVDPTSSTPTSPSTPSATTPVLTIADNSLWVAGRGGTVDLGAKVTTTDANDLVTVNITGLPRYESITDKLDGRTFTGKNITLTAAQVDSGLTLTSQYRGGGQPVATLSLTASATDPSTGAVSTASPQTITVTDPRPADVTTTTSSHHQHTATDHQPAATATAVAPMAPQTVDFANHPQPTTASTVVLASRASALLQQHVDPATDTLATTAPQPITVADHPAASGTTTASMASQSFALLNQYLAAHTGQVDSGQIVAAVSQAIGWGHEPLLARPQH